MLVFFVTRVKWINSRLTENRQICVNIILIDLQEESEIKQFSKSTKNLKIELTNSKGGRLGHLPRCNTQGVQIACLEEHLEGQNGTLIYYF